MDEPEIPTAAPEPTLAAFTGKPKMRKRKAAVKKKAAPKPKKFDAVLMQLVKEGQDDLAALVKIFSIDEQEFRNRLGTLVKRKWVVLDAENKKIHLSVEGVNAFKPVWKKAADEWLGRKEAPAKMEARNAQTRPPEAPLEKPVEQKRLDIEVAPEKEPALDLDEVIKRYGPNAEQARRNRKNSPFVERYVPSGGAPTTSPRAATQTHAATESTAPVALETPSTVPETCALCKSGFVSSMNAAQNNPKYGHCFCGSPYHKDCYEAILADAKRCVNCGRKLVLALDLKSEEAVGNLKDAFE